MSDNFDMLVTDAMLTSVCPDTVIFALCPTFDIREHFMLKTDFMLASFVASLRPRMSPLMSECHQFLCVCLANVRHR